MYSMKFADVWVQGQLWFADLDWDTSNLFKVRDVQWSVLKYEDGFEENQKF